MNCFCEQKETKNLKVEADYSADPFWCANCGCNLDLESLPITNELKTELERWVAHYGSWINIESDRIKEDGELLEKEHNKQGVTLTKKVQQQLKNYTIIFSPSNITEIYKQK